jgi:hypothetical protein
VFGNDLRDPGVQRALPDLNLNAKGAPRLGELAPDFDVIGPTGDEGSERRNGRASLWLRCVRLVCEQGSGRRGHAHGNEETRQSPSTCEARYIAVD